MSSTTASKKVVVITGATRGLGRALADEFARLGWRVCGCGRSATHLAELRRAHPAGAFAAVNVADWAAVEAWASEALATVGPPDLLLNNAAVINPNAPVAAIDPDDFSRLIDINVKGVFLVTRAFLPAMLARGGGVIVNFSSGWGRSTSPEVAPYCASKFAVEGFTLALAQELEGTGVAAAPLNPGVIDTDMLRSCFGGDAGGYPQPAAWAQAAAPFLIRLGPKNNGQRLTAPSSRG